MKVFLATIFATVVMLLLAMAAITAVTSTAVQPNALAVVANQ